MADRLQKILSHWGIASRRQAEQLILSGRVRLNGAVAQIGETADPTSDSIEVDGVAIAPEHRPELVYLLLHKPVGVISTCQDPQRRRTVLQLLPPALQQMGIHPIGRLDAASTGALLLTNDGALTACLTHPRHSVPKTYQVWVEGYPPEEVLQNWRSGIVLAGRMTRSAEVKLLEVKPSPDRPMTLLEIVLREGRNRQIRRVAEQLGFPVIHLHRTAIGAIQLGKLGRGKYRRLHQKELNFLYAQVQQANAEIVHLP